MKSLEDGGCIAQSVEKKVLQTLGITKEEFDRAHRATVIDP